MAWLRSLRKRVKAVSTYLAERREADRFQPEGWETAEGRALLSQYRAEVNGKAPAADLTREAADLTREAPAPMPAGPTPTRAAPAPAAPTPTGRGVARVPIARHSSDAVAPDTNHRPRHDGTQSQVDSSYLLTRLPASRHGTPGPAETARVLTITNVVRGPDGDPLAGAIVTISLIADCSVPGFQPNATIDGVARIVSAEEGTWSAEEAVGSSAIPVHTHYEIAEVTGRWPDGRVLVPAPRRPAEPAA